MPLCIVNVGISFWTCPRNHNFFLLLFDSIGLNLIRLLHSTSAPILWQQASFPAGVGCSLPTMNRDIISNVAFCWFGSWMGSGNGAKWQFHIGRSPLSLLKLSEGRRGLKFRPSSTQVFPRRDIVMPHLHDGLSLLLSVAVCWFGSSISSGNGATWQFHVGRSLLPLLKLSDRGGEVWIFDRRRKSSWQDFVMPHRHDGLPLLLSVAACWFGSWMGSGNGATWQFHVGRSLLPLL